MSELAEYQKFLEGLRLPNFSPAEITNYADRVRDGVTNSLPPRDLWDNLPPTLWVLQQLRTYLNMPVVLTSIYRSPAYNDALPDTASNSQHMRNAACDFRVPGATQQDIFDHMLGLRDGGLFRGGLGLYQTFVHIDTRGENATW